MSEKKLFLSQLKTGRKGIVVEIVGGREVKTRLHALGIRPGKEIVKVSSHFWKGPVTIKVGNSQVALGFGVAGKVLVKVLE